ncbi:MAG TPA: sigma-54 dependent transcriptional regulator [Candidatus Cloacimonadota bacterium]|nr:sigma-54 dependent transcriptional regulator [Candidatus Cloacimonadota bacterium]
MNGKVIILEDDVVLAQSITSIIQRKNYEVLHTTNSDAFFNELRNFKPDVILMDVFLIGSRLNGLQVLRYLRDNLDLNYKVIVISGEATSAQVAEIRELGAYHFIEKGSSFNVNQLMLHIDNAVTLKRQEEEHIGLQIEFINLKKQFTRSFPFIGDSDVIKDVRSQIVKLAEVDEDMFLIGETGTGKEVAANYYYINSRRFGKTFRTVNCSALTETIIESELFGHVKGSFTDADRNKTGIFEECSTGLLFLDEVSNLSLKAQAKILRSIENKEIQVVGGNMKKVDTRLIFASNADLTTLSDATVIRKDLFYRIEGTIVELPPLRERGSDILLLFSYFLSNYSSQYNIYDQMDLRALKDALLEYSWPGNIRELKNFCKFLMINEREITNAVILKHLSHKLSNSFGKSEEGLDKYLNIRNLKDSASAFERDYILHYLHENDMRVSSTAKAIGIERTTLYKKMKLFGITTGLEEE